MHPKAKTVWAIVLGIGGIAFIIKSRIEANNVSNPARISQRVEEPVSVNTQPQNQSEEDIYPKEQKDFINEFKRVNTELKKSTSNSYAMDDALANYKKFLATNPKVTDWIGYVVTVNEISDGTSVIDCKCYKNTRFELQFKDASVSELKRLVEGTKIRFSGLRDIKVGSIISDGTFSIVN